MFLLPACFAEVLGQTTTEFTPTQFHIQTDDGDRRFFKYQTWSGQVRKEDRLDDGSVVGSYGWVDANGILRLYDYVADSQGYRIVKTRHIDVKKQQQTALFEEVPEPAVVVKKKPKHPANVVVKPTFAPDVAFERQNIVDDNPVSSARLQRRISTGLTIDVQPIFDFNEENADLTTLTTPATFPTSTKSLFEARDGETSRTQFNPNVIFDETPVDSLGGSRPVARSRSEDGRQFVVVKRRRPNGRQPIVGPSTLDYQTGRAFHHEDRMNDGKRIGQFGYIDPIGVRRVVNYSTSDNGGIIKSKENDYVGTDTYFEAS